MQRVLEAGGKLEAVPVHDVAGLLKQWFRELPEPVVPKPLQTLLLRSASPKNTLDFRSMPPSAYRVLERSPSISTEGFCKSVGQMRVWPPPFVQPTAGIATCRLRRCVATHFGCIGSLGRRVCLLSRRLWHRGCSARNAPPTRAF